MRGASGPEPDVTVSSPGDRWEREADELAERALSGAAPSALANAAAPPPPVMRMCAQCAEEEEEEPPAIARRAKENTPAAPEVARSLPSLSGGEPLAPAQRRFFESRFGFDFSRVRVHTGAAADAAATALGARAFTRGNDIVFADGELAPESSDGQRLLAHELAHVVQGERAGGRIFREVRTAETERLAGQFLVDDDAESVGPDQMRKSDFLDLVRGSACAAADDQLRSVGRSTDGCPFVARWIDHYRDQPAAHVERAVHKYAPASRRATSAHDYVAPILDRVRAGVDRWIESGELPELPEGISLFGGGLLGGIFGGLFGRLFGGLSQMFFKRDGSSGTSAVAPLALGAGRPLDPATRSRMQSAFATDFGGVRIHTERAAEAISRRQGARAFTVGEEIGFAPGEYRPGTLEGDALIAHELAHVIQQRGASPGPIAVDADHALEEDADDAAVSAVTSLWSGAKDFARTSLPELKSGLRLQRCKSNPPERSKDSPFHPSKALTPQQLEQEKKQLADSKEKLRKDPSTYDPTFIPDVAVSFDPECYTYNFEIDSLDLDRIHPKCDPSSAGCTLLSVPKNKPVVGVKTVKQKIGTVEIDSPVVVRAVLGASLVAMYVPYQVVDSKTYGHELHHVVHHFRLLQMIKERLARNVRLALMEERKKAAQNPSTAAEILSKEAIKQIVAREKEKFLAFVQEETNVLAFPVDAADPGTIPQIPKEWTDFKLPARKPHTKGMLTSSGSYAICNPPE